MSDLNTLFFELIRVAIGTQDSLSLFPSKCEWEDLFEMAVKQSLVCICFVGLNKFVSDSEDSLEKNGIDEDLFYNWMGMAVSIQQRNELLNQQCIELQEKLSAAGFRSSILKGQGIASLYSTPDIEDFVLLRQPGDIDVYVECGREKAIEYAQSIQGEVDWDYKHLHLNIYNDAKVEMHYVPEVFLNLRKNRKLQRWFQDHKEDMFTQNGQLVTPNLRFNLFYILLHTYRHFLYEGVGLRQLMDYYFVLKHPSVTPSMKDETLTTIKSFGMIRFTKGVMWIMENVFGLEKNYSLCEVDEREGQYILDEVMRGGNFGHFDKRLKTDSKGKFSSVLKILKHNFHLLTHYPCDTVWAPIWIVYHWGWKKLHRI